ncbi:MAG: Asp-tRNA(Asn)/Glu-tRNA(Gln) amidotransferase subunit GatC [Parcubacteria group bacterium]|nr:Asp-tRNA(Asn)/Glu-tRNA(Gln) amidotransferase subunit GatC [Parcubacteria group bacterium]
MEKTEIQHLAELARVKITDTQLEALRGDLGAILNYVSKIKEVSGDTSGVSDLGLVRNVMREDGEPHESGVYSEDLLAEVPQREGQYIKVKKIL